MTKFHLLNHGKDDPISRLITLSKLLFLLVLSSFYSDAHALRLEVNEDTHLLLRVGSDLILYTHIIAGALGICVGYGVTFTKKGTLHHRQMGRLFVWAMLTCYAIALAVAPFLKAEQLQNTMAAVLALYFVYSAWLAARQKPYRRTQADVLLIVVAIFIVVANALILSLPLDGWVEDSSIHLMFLIIGSIALIGDCRIVYGNELPERIRIARHVWRMCFAFFLGTGSLFFGQSTLFPTWFSDSLFAVLLAFLPLLLMFTSLPFILKPEWMKRIRGMFVSNS